MEKFTFYEKDFKYLKSGTMSAIFRNSEGEILKQFHPFLLRALNESGIDLESRINHATPIPGVPEILIPTAAAYFPNGDFCGYKMEEATGYDYNQINEFVTDEDQNNLYRYAKIHFNIGNCVEKASNVVFPDLCTCDNIFVDSSLNVQFIDYDGLQIDGQPTASYSTSLGKREQYFVPKYSEDNHYTKELDKKSLIVLYFLDVFHINLGRVGTIDPSSGKAVTLDDIFWTIGLEDYDVMNKVWKIFHNNRTNEYLEEDVFRIADDYRLVTCQLQDHKKSSFKRLIKK